MWAAGTQEAVRRLGLATESGQDPNCHGKAGCFLGQTGAGPWSPRLCPPLPAAFSAGALSALLGRGEPRTQGWDSAFQIKSGCVSVPA